MAGENICSSTCTKQTAREYDTPIKYLQVFFSFPIIMGTPSYYDYFISDHASFYNNLKNNYKINLELQIN